MLSHPLLATLLAGALLGLATAASAFGDLDCIGTEFCTDEGCTASVEIYAITFDWTDNSLTIPVAGDVVRMTTQGPEATPVPGQLAYDTPDGKDLRLTFTGAEITMELFQDAENGTAHAICAAREAA